MEYDILIINKYIYEYIVSERLWKSVEFTEKSV